MSRHRAQLPSLTEREPRTPHKLGRSYRNILGTCKTALAEIPRTSKVPEDHIVPRGQALLHGHRRQSRTHKDNPSRLPTKRSKAELKETVKCARASKLLAGIRSGKGHASLRPDPFRETIIALLRKNDGELLWRLLETLSRDNSLNARRPMTCLVQQPELRDLIRDKR